MVFEEGSGSMQDLLEYESRINEMVPSFLVTGVCTYDLSRFCPSDIIDILHTHPLVVLDDTVQANPFFTPPGDFLRYQKNGRKSDHPEGSHARDHKSLA
jgi:hypothetical protein